MSGTKVKNLCHWNIGLIMDNRWKFSVLRVSSIANEGFSKDADHYDVVESVGWVLNKIGEKRLRERFSKTKFNLLLLISFSYLWKDTSCFYLDILQKNLKTALKSAVK